MAIDFLGGFGAGLSGRRGEKRRSRPVVEVLEARQVLAAVNPAATTTLLVGPSSPVAPGRPAEFAVGVAPAVPGGAVPTGMVAFAEDGVLLGEVPLNASGEALFFTQAIPAGKHAVAAVYLGDPSHAVSLSNYLAVTVTPAVTTTKLRGSSAKVTAGQRVTFTAVVSRTVPGGAVPTGMVAFFDDKVLIGEAPLNASGVAVFATQAIPAGRHTVEAVYTGDPSDTIGLSNGVTVAVMPLPKPSGEQVFVSYGVVFAR